MTDRRRIQIATFFRCLATGMIGVLVGIYLTRLRFDAATVGYIVGAGLAGGALSALLATIYADSRGRRRVLVELSLLSACGGLALALGESGVWIGIAAFVGMVNGMGRDRGAALVIEQAVLPSTVGGNERTQTFAWYNVVQDAGHACGGLIAGIPTLLIAYAALPEATAYRVAIGVYAVLMAVPAIMYAGLSSAIEAPVEQVRAPVTPQTRKVLWRISALFSLDALGGGFLTTALVSYFFFERFHTSPAVIGGLFFGARVMNAVSHLGAAWLAKRIGLVNTMVFTHIPSSLLLVTVAFAPTFPIAALLFLLREGLVEMDVPTRQSYVMAVVRPEERTVASGVTSLVRTAAWAVAPTFAGAMMQGVSLMLPLCIGAGMKIAYDILLYAAFCRVHPTEEA